MDLGHLPERILKARKARGWTREHLAVYASVSATTIGRTERGEHRPRASVIIALARALDLDPVDLAAEVGIIIHIPEDRWS